MADKTFPDLPPAGAITGTEIVPIWQSGICARTTASAIGGAAYKVYRALLTQSGTDAPVATVLENTLGGVPVWTRQTGGLYLLTLVGAFPLGKTFMSAFNPDNWNSNANTGALGQESANVIELSTFDSAFNSVDLGAGYSSVEILVYS